MAIALGLRLPRTEWPPFVLASTDPRVAPIVAVAKHDTAAMQRAVRQIDSLVTRSGSGAAAVTYVAIGTDIQLILGDSIGALRHTRTALDSLMPPVSFRDAFGTAGLLWPRMMLLRADLAAGLGFPEESRLWYRRFVDLWSGADDEFQPLVQRALPLGSHGRNGTDPAGWRTATSS